MGYVIVPMLWLVTPYAVHKGTVEENLLPGSGIENLLVSMIVGSLALAWSAGKALYRYLYPETNP
jgi:hypothetical protein